jgi:methylamine---glutamate N-methyltransferase subunit B
MSEIDLGKSEIREFNAMLHSIDGKSGDTSFHVVNPNGKHNIAVGVDADVDINIDGHAGHYVGGMNKHANITVTGNAGAGLGENIMSGVVRVKGNSSQYTGATGRGGLIVVEGDAAARCGISMKGVDIVVGGNVGHMCAFLGQSGNVVICGDAGDALGDSIFEMQIFVQGKIKSLGHDCEEKEMGPEQVAKLTELLDKAQIKADPKNFKVYGPARTLYNFKIDNAVL